MRKFLSNVKGQIRSTGSGSSDEPQQNQSSGQTQLFRHQASHDVRRFPQRSEAQSRKLVVANVVELGNVHSSTTSVKRDLGFSGRLGDYEFLSFGDTMFGHDDQFRGMTCNSLAVATTSPTEVLDPLLDENKYPRFFLRPNEQAGERIDEYSLGITSVIERTPGQGVVFFLLNHRPGGKDHILGAGLAEVSLDTSGDVPTVHANRLSKYWWDAETEPWYGDVAALKAGDFIYAYGHAKDNPWVYLTRVKVEKATDLAAYEYWNGTDWQSERLRREELNEKQSVFWQINQGQIYFSEYHNCFVFIHCDNFWSCQVLARTALAPEGPWSDAITIYKPRPIQEGGNIYAAIPHLYYDPSGETLIVTYTNHPNTIQAIQVEFADSE